MISERSFYIGLLNGLALDATPVGILKLARQGVIESGEFAYGSRYADRTEPLALNPIHIPLRKAIFKLQEQRLRDGGALPLTFRDALPDRWGRRVIEAQNKGPMDDIDVLLQTNADRVGAMVFSDSLDMKVEPAGIGLRDINELSEAVRRLELSLDPDPELHRLLMHGGTLGGARPKHTFVHESHRWIAKFPAVNDTFNVEAMEAATLEMASRCGINVPQHELLPIHHGGHALLVKRFDRIGDINRESRRHYLSASAILDVPYESNGGSYVALAEALRLISVSVKKDLDQLYRRLIFNLIVDNTDDHVKNHGVLHVRDNQYELSPAFDMVCQMNNIGYQQLAILPGRNDSNIKLALEAAEHFGIKKNDAEELVGVIKESVHKEFPEIVLAKSGSERMRSDVRRCLSRQWEIINA